MENDEDLDFDGFNVNHQLLLQGEGQQQQNQQPCANQQQQQSSFLNQQEQLQAQLVQQQSDSNCQHQYQQQFCAQPSQEFYNGQQHQQMYQHCYQGQSFQHPQQNTHMWNQQQTQQPYQRQYDQQFQYGFYTLPSHIQQFYYAPVQTNENTIVAEGEGHNLVQRQIVEFNFSPQNQCTANTSSSMNTPQPYSSHLVPSTSTVIHHLSNIENTATTSAAAIASDNEAISLDSIQNANPNETNQLDDENDRNCLQNGQEDIINNGSWRNTVEEVYDDRRKNLEKQLKATEKDMNLQKNLIVGNCNCLKEYLYQWLKKQRMTTIDTEIMRKKHRDTFEVVNGKFGTFYSQIGVIGKQSEQNFFNFMENFFNSSIIFSKQPPAFIKCEKKDETTTKDWIEKMPTLDKKPNNVFDIELSIVGFRHLIDSYHLIDGYFEELKADFFLVTEKEEPRSGELRKFQWDGRKISEYEERKPGFTLNRLKSITSNEQRRIFSESCFFKLLHIPHDNTTTCLKHTIGILKVVGQKRRSELSYNIISRITLKLKKDFLIWKAGENFEFHIASLPFGILTATQKITYADNPNIDRETDFNILRYFIPIKPSHLDNYTKDNNTTEVYICKHCHNKVNLSEITKHMKKQHHCMVIDGRKFDFLTGCNLKEIIKKKVYPYKLGNFLESIFLNLVEEAASTGKFFEVGQERRFSPSAHRCLLDYFFSSNSKTQEKNEKKEIESIIKVQLDMDALVLLKEANRFNDITNDKAMNYSFIRLYREFASWLGKNCYVMWSKGFIYGFCGQKEAENELVKDGALMIRFSGKTLGYLVLTIPIQGEQSKNHFYGHFSGLDDFTIANMLQHSNKFKNIEKVYCHINEHAQSLLKTDVCKQTLENFPGVEFQDKIYFERHMLLDRFM